jgi:cytoplasmic tRNA 2-thiolation protein 1
MPVKQDCKRCGYISSNEMCKSCVLLEGLNTGKAKEANSRKSNKVAIKIEETKE